MCFNLGHKISLLTQSYLTQKFWWVFNAGHSVHLKAGISPDFSPLFLNTWICTGVVPAPCHEKSQLRSRSGDFLGYGTIWVKPVLTLVCREQQTVQAYLHRPPTTRAAPLLKGKGQVRGPWMKTLQRDRFTPVKPPHWTAGHSLHWEARP